MRKSVIYLYEGVYEGVKVPERRTMRDAPIGLMVITRPGRRR